MAVHPWDEKRPLSSWIPAGVSERLSRKASRTVRPVICHDTCKKCSTCWLFCPDASITRGERYEIDYDHCKGCGLCARECPHGAIGMVREG